MATSKPKQDNFWLSLEGQHVRVPYLPQLFPSWRAKIHPEYQRARDGVLIRGIRRWVDDDTTCYKLQKGEFGVFAAILCADASFDRLCTTVKYFAWVIFDCGTLQGKPLAMKEYRETSKTIYQAPTASREPLPGPFRTCEVLSEAMLNYISAVDDANALFKDGSVPSVEAYWQRRDYAAGVYPTIATIPFALGVNVEPEYAATPDIQALWKSTSYLVHMTNDMLSLRKELKDGQIENIVPVLMLNEGLSINDAIQRSYHFAEENARGIDHAAAVVLSSADNKHRDASRAFARGCMDIAAGLICWRYETSKY
ncbi:terpenoid synthase [Aspergillus desertorum]